MMTSRGQKILQMTLTQAKCNEISEKPVITSLLTEDNAFFADNTQDDIIEDNDLQNLLTWVPKRFHEYFKNRPHGNLVEDDRKMQ